MKKLLLILMSLLVLTSISSCSDDNQLEQTQSVTRPVNKGHKLTIEQAINRSYEYLTDVSTPETRGISRAIASVECITNGTKTRNQNADTLLYLVNYKDNAGFLLMTADDRILPVYAFSDTGNLNLSDTTFNAPLRNYMEGIKYDVTNKLGNMDNTSGIFRPEFVVKDYLEPLASPYQSCIGQQAPYNNKCPIIDGQHALAGCVPVSFEIALSCLKSPKTYLNDIYHWEEMNNGENDADIATLLARLGDTNNLDANYGLERTGAYITLYYSRTFENFGFPNVSIGAFNNQLATQRLRVEPLVVYNSNHAWVIDGAYYPSIELSNGKILQQYYFHCVWGWNGSCNGFYLSTDNSTIRASEGKPWFYWEYDPQTGGSMNETPITQMIYQFQNVIFAQ